MRTTNLVILLFILYACNPPQKVVSIDYFEQYPILDSLKYIEFPDDNWGTDGNYYFKKIVSYGDDIVPALIERVADTLTTDINPYDVYYLRNSDIAIELLFYVAEQHLPMKTIFLYEFDDQLRWRDNTYSMLYSDLFFLNSDEQNYNNRLRLRDRLKDWYEKEKKYPYIKDNNTCHYYYNNIFKMNIYDKVDVYPEYNDGYVEFIRYVSSNLPTLDGEETIIDIVVTIVIDENGKPLQYSINNKNEKYYSIIEQEIYRRLMKIESWQPGKCGDMNVATIFVRPFRIRLNQLLD